MSRYLEPLLIEAQNSQQYGSQQLSLEDTENILNLIPDQLKSDDFYKKVLEFHKGVVDIFNEEQNSPDEIFSDEEIRSLWEEVVDEAASEFMEQIEKNASNAPAALLQSIRHSMVDNVKELRGLIGSSQKETKILNEVDGLFLRIDPDDFLKQFA